MWLQPACGPNPVALRDRTPRHTHSSSFHLPLHRALGQVLVEVVVHDSTARGTTARDSMAQDSMARDSSTTLGAVMGLMQARRGFARALLEHPLRALVLAAQVSSPACVWQLVLFLFF